MLKKNFKPPSFFFLDLPQSDGLSFFRLPQKLSVRQTTHIHHLNLTSTVRLRGFTPSHLCLCPFMADVLGYYNDISPTDFTFDSLSGQISYLLLTA
jgi:hypothetical protein